MCRKLVLVFEARVILYSIVGFNSNIGQSNKSTSLLGQMKVIFNRRSEIRSCVILWESRSFPYRNYINLWLIRLKEIGGKMEKLVEQFCSVTGNKLVHIEMSYFSIWYVQPLQLSQAISHIAVCFSPMNEQKIWR